MTDTSLNGYMYEYFKQAYDAYIAGDGAFVTPTYELLSPAAGWSFPAAGFSNPMYVATDVTDSTGWAILPGGEVTISFEGTYTGVTLVHQQTLDVTGATGWYNVRGDITSMVISSTPTGTGSATGGCYRMPATGFRHRLLVSAISTGTMIVRVKVSAQPYPLFSMSYGVQGITNHDLAISGPPVRIGARALTSNYTSVQTGDNADLISTLNGALIVREHAIPEQCWSYAAAGSGIVNTTTAVTFKAAAGASTVNYVTAVDIMSEVLGTATELAIRDGAGGTVLWRTKIPTTGLLNGRNIQFNPPIKSTANTLLEVVTLSASGTGAVYFNAQGYTGP